MQTRGERGGGKCAVCPWGSRCPDNCHVTHQGGSDVSGQQAESLLFWELRVLPAVNTGRAGMGRRHRARTALAGRPGYGRPRWLRARASSVDSWRLRLGQPVGQQAQGLVDKDRHRQGHWSKPGCGVWSQNRRDILASCRTGGQVAATPLGWQLCEGPGSFGKSSKAWSGSQEAQPLKDPQPNTFHDRDQQGGLRSRTPPASRPSGSTLPESTVHVLPHPRPAGLLLRFTS